jgi:starch synthase (maltosyl-transferring)
MLVITELDFGGAEQRLVDLATHIDRARFLPSVIALAGPPPPQQDALLERLNSADVPVRFLGAQGMATAWRTWRRLKKEFHRQSVDLVQSFLFHANVAVALAIPRGVPHFAGVRVADPRKSRMFVERHLLRPSQRIVCVSNAVADHLLHGGFSASQLTTIPNAVDVNPLDSATPIKMEELGIPAGNHFVAVIGRLDPQKGTDWLIDQIPALLKTHGPIHFAFCGRGNAEPYRAQAARLDIADHVHFLGWRTDVAAILKAANLLLLPSRWEGMPNVVLEAMALRRPILATRTHGVLELLGPSAAKMTFSTDKIEQFRDGLTVWLGKPTAELNLLLEANRRRVKAEFSVEKMVRRYQMVYEK